MIRATLALLVAVTFGFLLAPLDAGGQQAGTLPTIGMLGTPPPGDGLYRALLQGLHELGYAEGQNIRLEWRWGEPQRFPEFARELVRLHVDVIATFGTPAALAAKHATATIPIVMALVGDPVRTGIVASLAQPGANITGVTNLAPDMVPKRLELLKEAVPHASHVALLWNPANQDQVAHFQEAEAGARALGLTLQSVPVRGGEELEGALAAMLGERPAVLLMTGDTAIRQNNREEQRKIIRYNHLVANLVVFHNVVSMTRVLQELVDDGYVVTPEIITRLSPHKTEHINRFGHYELRFDHVPPPVTEELRLSPTSPEVGVIC